MQARRQEQAAAPLSFAPSLPIRKLSGLGTIASAVVLKSREQSVPVDLSSPVFG